MKTTFSLLSLMLFFWSSTVAGQETGSNQPCNTKTPAPVASFSRGAGLPRLEELSALISRSADPGAILAIRICSQKSLHSALFNARYDPLAVGEYAHEAYGLSREKILLLRDIECATTVAADVTEFEEATTEIYVLSSRDPLPPSAERSTLGELRLVPQPARNQSFYDARLYRGRLEMIHGQLLGSDGANAVIVGYYFDSPSRTLRQHVSHAQDFLRSRRIDPSRIVVVLKPWRSSDRLPSALEPAYPDIFTVDFAK